MHYNRLQQWAGSTTTKLTISLDVAC